MTIYPLAEQKEVSGVTGATQWLKIEMSAPGAPGGTITMEAHVPLRVADGKIEIAEWDHQASGVTWEVESTPGRPGPGLYGINEDVPLAQLLPDAGGFGDTV